MTTRLTPLERLTAGTLVTPTCWLWQRATLPNGYGYISVAGRMVYTHRLSYELHVGPIPHGFDIDHVKDRGCDHRNCVRPAHIEAVTRRTNLLRGNTLTRAHVLGLDCGHKACVSCRHRADRKVAA